MESVVPGSGRVCGHGRDPPPRLLRVFHCLFSVIPPLPFSSVVLFSQKTNRDGTKLFEARIDPLEDKGHKILTLAWHRPNSSIPGSGNIVLINKKQSPSELQRLCLIDPFTGERKDTFILPSSFKYLFVLPSLILILILNQIENQKQVGVGQGRLFSRQVISERGDELSCVFSGRSFRVARPFCLSYLDFQGC